MCNPNGMNWIRKDKRLAIYLRDGLACVYCGSTVDDEKTVLTLDHLQPREWNGSNNASNLVTACRSCNSARQLMPWKKFADCEFVIKRIQKLRRRKLDRQAAARIIDTRGGWSACIASAETAKEI